MVRSIAVFLLTLFVVTTVVVAQENMGARPIGLGGAYTGLADDANAVFLNPAGLGTLQGENALFSAKLARSSRFIIVAGIEELPQGTLGVGYLNEVTPSGDNEEINQSLYVAYGRELNSFMVVPSYMGRLSIGANLQLSNQRTQNSQGSSLSEETNIRMDWAMIFRANDNFAWGLNYQNALGQGSAQSAGNVNLGLSGSLFNKAVIWTAENQSVGCEWKPLSGLALRGGRDGNYYTSGLGVQWGSFVIDYGYLGTDTPRHYVSVSFAGLLKRRQKAENRQAGLARW